MDSVFTIDDLLKRLGAIVAECVSGLDMSTLAEADRDAFVRGVTGRTANTFWKTYVSALPGNVRSSLMAALERKDSEAVNAWYALYANFMEDAEARNLTEEILAAFRRELPKQIKNDFAAFTHVADYA